MHQPYGIAVVQMPFCVYRVKVQIGEIVYRTVTSFCIREFQYIPFFAPPLPLYRQCQKWQDYDRRQRIRALRDRIPDCHKFLHKGISVYNQKIFRFLPVGTINQPCHRQRHTNGLSWLFHHCLLDASQGTGPVFMSSLLSVLATT